MKTSSGKTRIWMTIFMVTLAFAIAIPAAITLSAPKQGSYAAAASASNGRPFELNVPPPPAVRRAGGKKLREFKEGSAVAAETGCLACHRIGNQGNRGPGVTLTHIGSKLNWHEIRDILLRPRAPMPSFKGLPRRKLRVLVRFLSLLR